jgi:hypothetical protein
MLDPETMDQPVEKSGFLVGRSTSHDATHLSIACKRFFLT